MADGCAAPTTTSSTAERCWSTRPNASISNASFGDISPAPAGRSTGSRGTVCEQKLPAGLRESDRLPEPIFTPATKADTGHDENISVVRMADLVGSELTERLKNLSIQVYQYGADHCAARGILLADTKFEFGFIDGELSLIDEVLTPDSSRYWPADQYEPGHGQPSFDKQLARDWLEATGWDKTPPAPTLPAEIVEQTSQRYIEVYKLITGEDW